MPDQNSSSSTWNPLDSEKSKTDTNLLLHPATRYNVKTRTDSRYTRPTLRLRKQEQLPFIETLEYRRFVEFCNACKEDRYPGICVGGSGVGKTIAAQQYASWRFFSHISNPHYEKFHVENAEVLLSFDTVVYTPLISMSANAVLVQILSLMSTFETTIDKENGYENSADGQVKLIIIDEANRLKYQSLEHLRDLFDQLRIGIVLMGLHGLEKYIACLPQLKNRIGFRHEFKPLSVSK